MWYRILRLFMLLLFSELSYQFFPMFDMPFESQSPACYISLMESLADPEASSGEANCCYCPQIWQPVCASDEQIYSNMCFFMCARAKLQHLTPQSMSFCQQPQAAVENPNAQNQNPPVENEGNGNPAAPNEGNGGGSPPAEPPRPPPNRVQHDYYPTNYNPYEPAFNGPPLGYLPVCHWSCQKVPTHPLLRICDDLNGIYYSDCEFYKAVCRAEMRGLLLRRTPCQERSAAPTPVSTKSKRRQTWLK